MVTFLWPGSVCIVQLETIYYQSQSNHDKASLLALTLKLISPNSTKGIFVPTPSRVAAETRELVKTPLTCESNNLETTSHARFHSLGKRRHSCFPTSLDYVKLLQTSLMFVQDGCHKTVCGNRGDAQSHPYLLLYKTLVTDWKP